MRDGRETFIWSAALFSRSYAIYLSTSASADVIVVVVVVGVNVVGVAASEARSNNGENDAKILFIRSLSLTLIGSDRFN